MQVSEIIIYLLGDRNSVSFSPKSCPCKLPVPLNDTNFSQSPRCQLFALLWGSSVISVLWASTMLLPPSKYLSPQPPSLACPLPLFSDSTGSPPLKAGGETSQASPRWTPSSLHSYYICQLFCPSHWGVCLLLSLPREKMISYCSRLSICVNLSLHRTVSQE